jgi:hypothetical protein
MIFFGCFPSARRPGRDAGTQARDGDPTARMPDGAYAPSGTFRRCREAIGYPQAPNVRDGVANPVPRGWHLACAPCRMGRAIAVRLAW